LSVVPNTQMKSALSLEIPTFPIEEVMVASPYRKDFFNQHLGFWKSLVIRNLQPVFNCSYRTIPNGPQQALPPLSERPIQGWGSYFEVVTADPAPNIGIDYVGALKKDALKE